VDPRGAKISVMAAVAEKAAPTASHNIAGHVRRDLVVSIRLILPERRGRVVLADHVKPNAKQNGRCTCHDRAADRKTTQTHVHEERREPDQQKNANACRYAK
jgi:hypothetical protein